MTNQEMMMMKLYKTNEAIMAELLKKEHKVALEKEYNRARKGKK
jgi:hypothetical protein